MFKFISEIFQDEDLMGYPDHTPDKVEPDISERLAKQEQLFDEELSSSRRRQIREYQKQTEADFRTLALSDTPELLPGIKGLQLFWKQGQKPIRIGCHGIVQEKTKSIASFQSVKKLARQFLSNEEISELSSLKPLIKNIYGLRVAIYADFKNKEPWIKFTTVDTPTQINFNCPSTCFQRPLTTNDLFYFMEQRTSGINIFAGSPKAGVELLQAVSTPIIKELGMVPLLESLSSKEDLISAIERAESGERVDLLVNAETLSDCRKLLAYWFTEIEQQNNQFGRAPNANDQIRTSNLRSRFLDNLTSITTTDLIPTFDEYGFVPAVEIYVHDKKKNKLFVNGTDKQITDYMQRNRHKGNRSWDMSLVALYRDSGIILEKVITEARDEDNAKDILFSKIMPFAIGPSDMPQDKLVHIFNNFSYWMYNTFGIRINPSR
jgi:hypothetical protein